VKINGLAVSEKCLKKSLDVIVQESKKYLPHASFFELITATALLIFFKKKVDVLVCEVGLGGHFDSTNALCPFVSVLTNISLEHTDFLGHSLQDIAADKAYISRKNKPFIVGKVSNQAVQGIVETTNIIGAELIFADDIENKDQEFLLLNLKMGSFAYLNAENLKLALCAVFHFFLENSQKNFPLDPQKIKQAIESTYWPGRFDVRTINGRSVIFDAAHNFDGFLFFLAQYQKSLFRSQKCILVFASLKDKNWKKTLTLFPRIACSVIFTQIDSKRAEDARSFENYIYQNESTDLFSSYKGVNIATFLKLDDALEAAMNQSPPHPLLMIGSIAFIGKAMSRFGLSIVRGLE
jgi:dihydrofolate synthase/folylpolyglutamate synthase